MGKELFQTVQWAAPTQGIENHAQHNGPWIDGHLGWHHLIDHLDQANLVGIGLHNGQMLDVIRFDRRQNETHTTLQGRKRCRQLLSCAYTIPLLGMVYVLKMLLEKYVDRLQEGAGCEFLHLLPPIARRLLPDSLLIFLRQGLPYDLYRAPAIPITGPQR